MSSTVTNLPRKWILILVVIGFAISYVVIQILPKMSWSKELPSEIHTERSYDATVNGNKMTVIFQYKEGILVRIGKEILIHEPEFAWDERSKTLLVKEKDEYRIVFSQGDFQ